MNENGLNVLSLFDGIGGGRCALDRAGIKVNGYHASEICDYAIKIAQKNWNDITEIGDVRDVDGTQYNGYLDLLIGGSPCQNFSFAGKMNGASTKDNIEITSLEQYLDLKEKGFEFDGYSYLFWEYVRVLKESKPKYFLLENVKMCKKWQDVITQALGVEPIMIDSKLLSAQSRKRLYWTNIPNVTQPMNKDLTLKDIVQPTGEKEQYNITDRLNNTKEGTLAYEKAHKAIRTLDQKMRCLMTGQNISNSGATNIQYENGEYYKPTPIECERAQTLPDNYTEGLSDTQRYKCIGNGWTIDVIAHIFNGLK